MWIHLALAALAAIGPSLLPEAGQEQASIDLPDQVALEHASIAGSAEPSRPVAVGFSQVVLSPGRSLRLSVRAEEGGDGCRIFFTTRNARGGVGRSGRVGEEDFVPVFESFPWAHSGGFEVSWSLETPGKAHAGRRSVTLRWRIESMPAPAWMEHAGAPGGGGDTSSAGPGPPGGEPPSRIPRPGTSVWEKPDRKDRRRPPAEEVP